MLSPNSKLHKNKPTIATNFDFELSLLVYLTLVWFAWLQEVFHLGKCLLSPHPFPGEALDCFKSMIVQEFQITGFRFGPWLDKLDMKLSKIAQKNTSDIQTQFKI